MDRRVTRIFYLVLWSLTLTAAAVQWLPRDGFPPDIDLGPDEARAQTTPADSAASATSTSASSAVAPSAPFSPYSTPSARNAPGLAPAAQPATAVQTNAAPANDAARGAAPFAPPPGGPANAPFSAPLPLNGPAAWQPPTEELEGTRVLARVGGEVILSGEVIASVNAYLARSGYDIRSPEVLAQRDTLIRMRLQQLIDTRAVLNEAKRKIPEEGLKKAMQKFDEDFDKTVVPQMLRDRKVADAAQLEELLKREGTTLERQKRDFAETILCKSWLGESAKYDSEVTHEQMLQFYHRHAADYEFPAECRWEQISMRFEKFPTKGQAFAALAQAGNEVIQGRPFAEVAKAASQGSTASQGGAFDWTKQGSLASKPLDEALFALPLGMLSQIIEDERGFHIVRVVERRDARRTPFLEAQVEIKKKIVEERANAARKQYVEDVRKRTTVWTAYDDPSTAPSFNTARPPAAAMQR